ALDFDAFERLYDPAVAERLSPEAQFARRWAFCLLEKVIRLLREEYVAAGNGEEFHALNGYLPGGLGGRPYKEVALTLGIETGYVGVLVHRMRRRYGVLLDDELVSTAGSREQVP